MCSSLVIACRLQYSVHRYWALKISVDTGRQIPVFPLPPRILCGSAACAARRQSGAAQTCGRQRPNTRRPPRPPSQHPMLPRRLPLSTHRPLLRCVSATALSLRPEPVPPPPQSNSTSPRHTRPPAQQPATRAQAVCVRPWRRMALEGHGDGGRGGVGCVGGVCGRGGGGGLESLGVGRVDGGRSVVRLASGWQWKERVKGKWERAVAGKQRGGPANDGRPNVPLV